MAGQPHTVEVTTTTMGKKKRTQSRSATADLSDDRPAAASEPGQLQAKVDELAGKLERRDGELAEVQLRVAAMEKLIRERDTSVAGLQAEIARLQVALQQKSTASPPAGRIASPEIHDVVDQLPKHAALKYASRKLDRITHLCIHHSATAGSISLENVAKYHVDDRGWPGIGYHFYVKPDGLVYQTNRMETISYQVSQNNDYSVGVCVSGDFTYAPPPDKQVEATARLVAWLMQELSVPEQNVMGHKEFPDNDTSCPGETWLKNQCWKNTLTARIRAVQASASPAAQAKRIEHYMLFWQKPGAWAQADWAAAETYFGRFRPTAGFSVTDAMTARAVTIVGGPAGVSVEAEQQLRAAGCLVERLAGVDFAETKTMLNKLAAAGRRFQSLPG
jgi:hypothetical protein